MKPLEILNEKLNIVGCGRRRFLGSLSLGSTNITKDAKDKKSAEPEITNDGPGKEAKL